MINIDQYVYANKLLTIHPAEKSFLAMATMVVCLISTSIYTPIMALTLMAGLIIFKADIPAKFFGHLMLIPIAFLVMGELTLAISISDHAEGFLYHFVVGDILIGVTATDLDKAVLLLSKSLGSVSCLYFLALTTPMLEITSVLRKLKVPALFLELMSLIYRLIFVLLDSAATIRTSQSSRLGYVNWNSSFRSTSQLFYALLIKSFQRSQALATALEARCYQGDIRVLEKEFPCSVRNYIIISIIEVSLILLNFYIGGGKLFG
ncbi:cobalt ECF transporter T component CbiQ [Desulfitobacterium metallireducens]|uniref:Cobalt ABC transporter permease n=1 Tax=Desulfitobacterium metallireducens DSM 15288 TaxID=871968 RepID=W0EC03_9FIRM|nr:cobalt ECF transporter T component CbiQ [Desulfitobacterium metallireducens]AHF06601.1 cobalt ABC transporter permease [Desulfitobacterium metallireducens DSM 15288]